VRLEDADHIVIVEHDHESGDEEEEPGYPHPQVDEGSGRFVLLVHVLFVVYVVCSHLQNQCVVRTSPAQGIEPLRLISPQGLRRESVEVPVVGVLGGSSLKPVHSLMIIYTTKYVIKSCSIFD